MIKEDIIKLYNTIQAEKSKGSVKFRYLLLKNEGVIKQEISTLGEVEKDINNIIEPFIKERDDLIRKIGVPSNGAYSVPSEKIKEFNEKIKPIKKKYEKVISEHDKKYKEYLSILKEDVTESLEFIEMKIEDLPQDIRTESLEILMKLGILK
ncbi:hypothetical protein NL50_17260 [Clostridium acetobutylicum]|nr:hypothetical protein NL50_17260 [Clostridium acetobutylicum]